MTTATQPNTGTTAATASAAPNLSPRDAQRLRWQLVDAGWRELNSATDFRLRRHAGDPGAEVTVGYFPAFRQLGHDRVAMWIEGRPQDPEAAAAAWLEVYRFDGADWTPQV